MQEIKSGERYRHFKGIIIEILCVGLHSETQERMVVYKHIDKEQIWIRPETMFFEEVDPNRTDNLKKQIHRFEKITE